MQQRRIDLEKRFEAEQYRIEREERREVARLAREGDRFRAQREACSGTVAGLYNAARQVGGTRGTTKMAA